MLELQLKQQAFGFRVYGEWGCSLGLGVLGLAVCVDGTP